MKRNLCLVTLVGFISVPTIAQISPSDLEKRQTRIFDGQPKQIREAILTFHRNREDSCQDSEIVIVCRERRRGFSESYTYYISLSNNKTVVRLVTLSPESSTDGWLVDGLFNQIERRLITDSMPSTPQNAKDAEVKSGVIPNVLGLLTRENEDRETRRFGYSVGQVQAGIDNYLRFQRSCKGGPDEYQCPTKGLFGLVVNKPQKVIVEYKVRDNSTTDVRIRLSSDVFFLGSHDEIFKNVLNYIESKESRTGVKQATNYKPGEKITSKTEGVKVNSEFSSESRQISILSRGESVIFLGVEKNGFLYVLGPDGEGWVDSVMMESIR